MSFKLTPFRLYSKLRSISRIKYWRGYGVHSPFMYHLVRNALMRHRLIDNTALSQTDFKSLGICQREQTMIKNIYVTNNYTQFKIVTTDTQPESDTLYLIPLKCDDSIIGLFFSRIAQLDNCGIIFGNTNRSHKRYNKCKSIVQRLNCVSLTLHCMFIIFIGEGLKKQHYRMRN
jgi:hypothetical protein